MRPLRTAQDIRTAPKGSACQGPATEQWAYAGLTRLAREKQRRLTQQASLQHKLGQVARSLADIEAQTERLHRQLPRTAGRPQALRRSPPRARSRSGHQPH